MILAESYDPGTGVQKIWYDSSTLFYTSFSEKTNKLTAVFKSGTSYSYSDVDTATDYMMFKHAFVDGSHGKSFNKFIKSKHDVVKEPNPDMSKLEDELNSILNRDDSENTVFISGHRNITKEEFEKFYKTAILYELETNQDVKFVIGDYYGVDIMAQDYLMDELELSPNRITVYHMLDKPMNINKKITQTVGGFKSDEERDAAMTEASFKDIAFVRDHLTLSGTGMNILRRNLLK